MPRHRIDYPAGTPLAAVLDQLAEVQRLQRSGEPSDLAAAGRVAYNAETATGHLVDQLLEEASRPPHSARKLSADTGIPVSTVTYRSRRGRNRAADTER